MYWSVSQVPEMKGLDRSEANKIWREAARQAMKDPRYWACFLPAGALAGLGSVFGALGAAVGGGLGDAVSGPLAMNVIRPYAAELVRQRPSSGPQPPQTPPQS